MGGRASGGAGIGGRGPGETKIETDRRRINHRISVLRAGSIVGEAALFGDIPRMANVEAMSNCVVWTLTAKQFEELARRSPEVALKLAYGAAAVLASRTRANLERALPLS